MVNGGGSIVLTFQRPSFLSASAYIFVPWNEFVVAPSVTMKTPREPAEAPQGLEEGSNCDVSLLSPPNAKILITTVRAYTAAECAEKGSVVPEIQVIPSKIRRLCCVHSCKRQKRFGGRTKFARIFFHLPEFDRFSWQLSRYTLLKFNH